MIHKAADSATTDDTITTLEPTRSYVPGFLLTLKPLLIPILVPAHGSWEKRDTPLQSFL
jgi:hypothetical protein